MPMVSRLSLAFAFAATLGALAANGPAWADAAEDQAIERKIAPVIECINTVDAPLMRAIEGYRKLVAEIKEEPNGTSLAFMGGFEQGDFHFPKALKCSDDLTSVAGAPPKLEEFDRMASDYATTLRAFAPIAIEADPYYHQKDYKDDKWAKGAALDEKLAPLVEKLAALSNGIRAGIAQELAAIRERRLAAIEAEEGKGFNWYTFNFMLAARAVLDAFENEDTDALAPAIARLQRGFDDGTAYATAHEAELDVKPDKRRPGWVYVRDSAGNYLRNVKEMRRALDPESKTPEGLLRTKFESVVNAYNSLVGDYNQRNSH